MPAKPKPPGVAFSQVVQTRLRPSTFRKLRKQAGKYGVSAFIRGMLEKRLGQ